MTIAPPVPPPPPGRPPYALIYDCALEAVGLDVVARSTAELLAGEAVRRWDAGAWGVA